MECLKEHVYVTLYIFSEHLKGQGLWLITALIAKQGN